MEEIYSYGKLWKVMNNYDMISIKESCIHFRGDIWGN